MPGPGSTTHLRRGAPEDGSINMDLDMDDKYMGLTSHQMKKAKIVENPWVALVKKSIAEFLGTFMLVSTVGFAGGGNDPLAALADAAALWAAIFAFGHVSGAHFNPAVTLAVYVRGKCPIADMCAYFIAQFLGAFAGAGFSNADLSASCLSPDPNVTNTCGAGYPAVNPDYAELMVVPVSTELIWTFFLATVVLNVATTKAQDGNSFFGLAIASVVLSGAVAVGNISGGALNPAVGTALPIIAGDATYVWVYWLGPLLGGALAGVVFRITSPASEFEGEEHQGCILLGDRRCPCARKD